LYLTAMYLTFFHVDPKRSEECNSKPNTKNQRRDDEPASPFVSQKGYGGRRNADDQDNGAEHSIGMAQRIRFVGAAQHTCDGEKTHNRVSGGSETQDDLENLPDHDRRSISRWRSEQASRLRRMNPSAVVAGVSPAISDVVTALCDVISVRQLLTVVPSCFETRSLPTLTRSYPRHFTFYLANSIRSIPH